MDLIKERRKMNDNRSLTKFFVASVLFLIWNVVQGALQSQGPIHAFLEQGPAGIIIGAHVHVGTLGWVTLGLAGALYYLVPQVSGKPLSWPKVVNWIFWIFIVMFPINSLLMILAGIFGGKAFIAGAGGPEIEAVLTPYMIPVGILSIICGVIWLIFSIQIIHTAAKKTK
ncbi:MAG: cbb3-type cytochrome c oxidase subunit I [Nitrososphaeraceae archaeon]